MVVQQRLESAGVRFGVYVEDLREFLRSRQVPFGLPGNLVAFAARVEKAGSFQDEMGSMVRSILFQEYEALGRGARRELRTGAVGGPAVDTGEDGGSHGGGQVSGKRTIRSRSGSSGSGIRSGKRSRGFPG